MKSHKLILSTSGYIPEIFHGMEKDLAIKKEIVNPENPSWTEIVAHLAQFNQYNVKQAKSEIMDLLESGLTDNKAIVYAGLAKCYIAEGQLMDAIKLLGMSYSILDLNPENRAFLLLEMVNLMTLIGYYDQSIILLGDIKKLTQSDYLKRLSYYYELVTQMRKGEQDLIPELKDSASYFETIEQNATLASHYKTIGNMYGKQKSFQKAESFYKMGLNICGDKYSHIREAIAHDLGMMQFRMGNSEDAVRQLSDVFTMAQSAYTQSYTAGNIGFIYFKEKKYQLSKDHFKTSFNIAGKSGVFHLIPGICYYLGKSSDKLGLKQDSVKYYKKGSETALELARHNFPLKGEKLLVIEEYMKLSDTRKITKTEPDKKQIDFAFAIDKSLKEIRATFQNAALKEILKITGSVSESVKHLNLSKSAYSKISKRTKEHKYETSLHGVKHFIATHDQMDWKEINTEFEKNLFKYLYLEYDLNKRKMSKKLGVNYSRFVSKMNQMVNLNIMEKN